MPLTDCPTHGESASVELCTHLYAALQAGVYLPCRDLPVFRVRLCEACVHDHAVADLGPVEVDEGVQALRRQSAGLRSLAPDALLETEVLADEQPDLLAHLQEIYDAVNATSRLMCVGCIDRIQVDHAQTTGAALPCEPFERTLVNGDDPRLQELAVLIRSALDPRGNHEGRFYGCRVSAGTALRPLTVEIFGATDQDAVLRKIDDFFQDIEAPQRRVRFFEPMSWSSHQVDGQVTRVRQPHVLLAEFLIR